MQEVNPRMYYGDEIQYVHQSTYFHSAEKTAHVPFLDHQILEVDCAGREYTNVDHDITLRIPEGAVAEDEKIHFEEVNPHVYHGDKIQYVHQSTYFHSAKKTANVPFLDHQILEVDCAGREYTNVDHDITLRIPEGALAEGEKIHFEVGVTMYGPFIYSENTQPISPILWLCILEEDIELKKPFQVVLPHYLIGLSKERIQHHHIRFSKANHCNYTFVDNQMTYRFEPYYDAKPHLATSGYRNYGVLTSKHCCFYCLEAKATPELAEDAGYCLVQIESPLSPQRNEVFFAGIYFLDTCLRSLEEQFTHEGGYNNIAKYTSFKSREASIYAVVPKQDSQYTIGFQPSNACIKISDIAFWDKKCSVMKRKHERRMYPPRVKMTVSIKDLSLTHFVLPVKFVGCRDNELDTDLTLPLGSVDVLSLSLTSIPSSRSASVGSQNSEPHSKYIICGKPKLKDIFKELYTVAASWKSIGTLLGIPGHILDNIKSNEERADERLREMLSEWLKQIDPPPTWTALAEAVEVIDESKAQRLKRMQPET